MPELAQAARGLVLSHFLTSPRMERVTASLVLVFDQAPPARLLFLLSPAPISLAATCASCLSCFHLVPLSLAPASLCPFY